jgi:hypothetical protein
MQPPPDDLSMPSHPPSQTNENAFHDTMGDAEMRLIDESLIETLSFAPHLALTATCWLALCMIGV